MVRAQEMKNPSDFYSRDFAKTLDQPAPTPASEVYKEIRKPSSKATPQDAELPPDIQALIRKQTDPNWVNEMQNDPMPTATQDLSVMNMAGKAVLSFNAVIDATDLAKAVKYVDEALEVSRRYKIKLTQVFLVGGFDLAFDQNGPVYKLTDAAVPSSFPSAPPSGFNITTSPAWILETKEGQIVVEGASLSKYLNSRGELVNLQ